MINRRILGMNMMFMLFTMHGATCVYGQMLDKKSLPALIENHFGAKDLRKIEQMFADDISFVFSPLDLSFNRKDDYMGFTNKKGDLYRFLFVDTAVQKLSGILTAKSLNSILKDKDKKVITGEITSGAAYNGVVNPNYIFFQSGNDGYSIFYKCMPDAEEKCRILLIEYSNTEQ